MISPTCGSWIGAAHLPGDPPRVGGDRPAGGVLGAAAGVGAAVEAPAGGALVDLPGAVRDRLAQPVGVAAGVLHLVGVRRPVDAAVGHPAGRQPGPAAASEPAALLAVAGGSVVEHLLEVDVLVELLELAGAGGRDRLLERVGERPRAGPVAGGRGRRLRRGRPLPRLHRILRARQPRRRSVAGRARRRFAGTRGPRRRAARARRRGSTRPWRTGRRARGGRARRAPRATARRSPVRVAGVDDPVVGARSQVDGRARGEVARQRLTERPRARAPAPVNAGRITSVTAACSARRTNRPRSESGGNSRTPWASIRGSSSSRRSTASCRSAGSSDSDSAMSCSIAQRLVCLAWSVSCSATPKQRRIARALERARRRSPRAGRAAPRSRGTRCGSGSRCARGRTVRGRSAPTPGTGAGGSPSSGRTGPGRRGRAVRAARRRGAAAARTPPAVGRSFWWRGS